MLSHTLPLIGLMPHNTSISEEGYMDKYMEVTVKVLVKFRV